MMNYIREGCRRATVCTGEKGRAGYAERCQVGSEGRAVKPDVAIREGARLLPWRVDRRVLAAGLQHPRRLLPGHPGQCAAHQGGARSQVRCQGQRLDRRLAAPWSTASASFIPPKPIRDLRDLVRYRKTLVQQRAQQINRVQKVLETANIKLSSVASDVLGKSGRAMVDAVLAGVTDADALADLALKRLRAKLPALRQALEGQVEETHRILLRHLLDQIDGLERQIEQLSGEIDLLLHPYEELLARLMQIPGIGRTTAAAILAEIGTDMTCFPSAKHLASWAGVAPGNRQSAGKRLKAAAIKGNTHLRAVLAEAVWV